MYFQIESVLEKYNLADAKTFKGRQVLLCEKDQKLYALKEYAGTQKKAEFLYQLGRYFLGQGICTDELIKTNEGALFVEGVDGIQYTLHRWYRGKECDIKNPMDIMLAVSHLAKFHMVARGFCQEGESLTQTDFPSKMESPSQEYERHNRELKKIYRFVAKRKQKSPYENLFLSCFREFYGQCEAIKDQMEQKHMLLQPQQEHICHGDVNYHNILFSATRPVVINFDKAGYGLQIFDFCNFKRKVMEKQSWDGQLGLEMLREYHRICPLDEVDFWQMYFRLAYPEKFWKLANRYYVSNKAWISRQNYEKLEKEIGQNACRKEYLTLLLDFYGEMYGKK